MANHFFRWNKIAVNTWIGRTPNGWIIKSVDTKTKYIDESDDRAPSTMSSSLVEIYDPTHSWKFNKFRWENIELDTWRARVIGGWIVKSAHTLRSDEDNEDEFRVSSSMIFTPDPSWGWQLSKPNTALRKETSGIITNQNDFPQPNEDDLIYENSQMHA